MFDFEFDGQGHSRPSGSKTLEDESRRHGEARSQLDGSKPAAKMPNYVFYARRLTQSNELDNVWSDTQGADRDRSLRRPDAHARSSSAAC